MQCETIAHFENIDYAELAARRLRAADAGVTKLLIQAASVDVPDDFDFANVQNVSAPIFVSALGFGSTPYMANIWSPVPPSLYPEHPAQFENNSHEKQTAVMHIISDSQKHKILDNCLRSCGAYHIVH